MSEEDQQNRLPFEEAIKISKVSEIPTEFTPEAVSFLKERLSKTNLMLFGEIHGVKENPNIIYTIMKEFGFVGLALEWQENQLEIVNNFLQSGKLDMKWLDKTKDGRITAGHFALLKRLQDENMLQNLILFDGLFPGTWNGRDKSMAKRIMEQRYSSIPTLVVAGDLHTRTELIHLQSNPEVTHPMGFHILKDCPLVPTGKIVYFSGEFYNLERKNFEEVFGTGQNSVGDQNLSGDKPRFILKDGKFYYILPEATAAIVP